MKTAVAYVRVSTAKQVDKFGLDAQKEMILKYAAEHDIEIKAWYIEKAESGAKDHRPEMDKLLYQDAVNPPVEAVLVAKWDRVARDVTLYYAYKYQFKRKNIELISVSEDFSDMGPYAVILEAFVVATAEIERGMITARTSGGRKTKAFKGGFAGGKAPYGYRIDNSSLVIDEEEAKTVRMIFDLRDNGKKTMRDIIAILKENGRVTRAGTEFAPSTIKSILDNRPIYEGMYKYGPEMDWVEGQQEPIL